MRMMELTPKVERGVAKLISACVYSSHDSRNRGSPPSPSLLDKSLPKPNLSLLLLLAVLTASASGDASIDNSFYFSPSPSPHPHPHPALPLSQSPSALYEPILNHLGFHTLASAVPSLTDFPSFSAWNGPSTIFAATDSSLSSSCLSTSSSAASCFVPRILRSTLFPASSPSHTCSRYPPRPSSPPCPHPSCLLILLLLQISIKASRKELPRQKTNKLLFLQKPPTENLLFQDKA